MPDRSPELRRLLATLGALIGLTVLLVAFLALVLAVAANRTGEHRDGFALLAAAFALGLGGISVFGWAMHALGRNWRGGPPGTNEV
jgi:hypothetical protein